MSLPQDFARELSDFFLELSSPIRVQMLRLLREEVAYRNSQMARTLNISAQESLRHLQRLVDSGLVEVRERTYALTPIGELILETVFPELEFLIKNEPFLSLHDLSVLPPIFTRRFVELYDSEVIQGPSEIIALAEEVVANADIFIWDVAKLVMRSTNQLLASKVDHVEVRRIEEEGLRAPSRIPQVSGVETRSIPTIEVAMVCTEKEAYIRFPLKATGELSLSHALFSRDPIFLNFVKDLFLFYWEQGRNTDLN